MQSVNFTNWTDEDFTWTWNSVPYTFKKGRTILIEDYLANHFAKHLIDRELFAQNKQTSDQSRSELLKKCIQSDDESVDVAPEKLVMELLNRNAETSKVKPAFCNSCDSKGIRHKKECPTLIVKVEEVFEGLK